MIRLRIGRFVAFLLVSAVLIGTVTLLAGLLVGRGFESYVLRQQEEHTAEVVRSQARQHLTAAAFVWPLPRSAADEFQTFMEGLPGVFRVKVFDPSGRIVWSNEPRLLGQRFPDNPHVIQALAGRVVTVLEAPQRAEHVYERARGYVAEAYVPIVLPGRPDVVAVIETYTDMTALLNQIVVTRRTVWLVAGALGLLLYAALAVVVWRASARERQAIGRLQAQNRELRLIQQFTRSVLEPVDLDGLAARIVTIGGSWLGLSRTALFRVTADQALVPLAAWPPGAAALEAPDEMTTVAVHTRRRVTHEALTVTPLFTQGAWVFVGEFSRPAAADGRALELLDLLLGEAAIALANVELFTEIREARERLAAILAGVADQMLIVDRDLRVVWRNVAAAAAGSIEPGRPCWEGLGEPAACQACPAARTLESGQVERGVRVQRLPDGRQRYLDLVAAPLRDASGHIYQALEVGRDITELVEMEERLKLSRAWLEESHTELSAKADELEGANRALRDAQAQLVEKERLAAVGEVVVGLHHAILNPLTGILGAVQVLKQEASTQPRMGEALARAEEEIRKIEQLVRRLPSLRRTPRTAYVGDTRMLDLQRIDEPDPGGAG